MDTSGRTAFLQTLATMLVTPLMPAQSPPDDQIRFDAIRPLITEVAALSRGDSWSSEAERVRYHDLVQAIFESVRPLLQELADAGILSGTLSHDEEEYYAWFEVDRLEVAGTINFAGRTVLESSPDAPWATDS